LAQKVDLGVDAEPLPGRRCLRHGQRERFDRAGRAFAPVSRQRRRDVVLSFGFADGQQLPGRVLQAVAQSLQPSGEGGQRGGIVQRIVQRLEVPQTL
jgi:hypothetical protein